MNQTKEVKVQDPRFVNFPSIYDLHRVYRGVKERAQFVSKDPVTEKVTYDQAKPLPVLQYRGSVKIHGTNAAIVQTPTGIHGQSRENMIHAERDHFDFQANMDKHMGEVELMFSMTRAILGIDPDKECSIALMGEWAGGRVQTKASLAVLPMFFTIAAVNVDGVWYDMRQFKDLHSEEARIFNTEMFETHHVTIDFARFDLIQTQLAEITMGVEKDCPVARYFGIKGIGEGLVWNCVDDPDPRLWLKVKGQEHSNTNVKVLNTVDTEDVAKHYNFVDAVTQLPRMEQGIHVMIHEKHLEVNEKNMSEFIRWVYADIVREEEILMQQQGIDPKKIGRPVSEICKKWYLQKLRESN